MMIYKRAAERRRFPRPIVTETPAKVEWVEDSRRVRISATGERGALERDVTHTLEIDLSLVELSEMLRVALTAGGAEVVAAATAAGHTATSPQLEPTKRRQRRR